MASDTSNRPQPALRRHFTYRLNVLSKLNDLMSQELYQSGCGLSLPESRCLAAIGSSPGHLTVNEVAFETNLDKAQVSRTVKTLVGRGLVSKRPCPVDGRAVLLTVTADGQQRWERVMPLIDQRNQDLLRCLNEQEKTLLLDMFERLLNQARNQFETARLG
ncbi:MarR family transcriptional regulator [Malikia sp.]|uniref:MarR family winged helix-turn-helix transcriptional regulator n=1 Tax=Malikia sp. TaxID=2070706 RepID=UPI002614EBF0|nr:MarR family transcriptional regulator [Malikia sp.]MDD2729488.1 MarR family transcriptional regulator [Malikia sp.]